jgi:hypothetical protein
VKIAKQVSRADHAYKHVVLVDDKQPLYIGGEQVINHAPHRRAGPYEEDNIVHDFVNRRV